jgi:diguanylate cyclase (GGDEF)-like protein
MARLVASGVGYVLSTALVSSAPGVVVALLLAGHVRPGYVVAAAFVTAFATAVALLRLSALRLLAPVRALLHGTERVANQEFEFDLPAHGPREIRSLITAFRAMAHSLQQRFRLLATQSELDAVIMSAEDPLQLMELVLVRLGDILSCECAAVWLVGTHGEPVRFIYWDEEAEGVELAELALPPATLETLFSIAGPMPVDAGAPDAWFAPLAARGIENGTLVPLVADAEHAAALFVRARGGRSLSAEEAVRLDNLAARLAVAITNAAWESRLYHQAHFDALTELPNRRMFKEILDGAVARAPRNQHLVGVLFIDLDDFKVVNDSFGHAAGDRLLKIVAHRLRDAVRATDSVARLGGDEFVVIIPDLRCDEIAAYENLALLADKILEELGRPAMLEGRDVRVTASIGAALCPRDARTTEELMRHADAAMYAAKEDGSRGFRVYSRELTSQASRKLRLREDLAAAVHDGQMVLHFQPRIDARTLAIVGCEALLRWDRPGHGLVPPHEFMEDLEHSGLILELGAWVLRESCRQIAQWRSFGEENLALSVNVTARQFNDPGFVALVEQVLGETGVPPASLELEFSEATGSANLERALGILARLKELGVRLAIDDFGAGAASLRHLHQMPVDTIKVDRPFVQEIGRGAPGIGLADAILALGKSLGLRVVAEGVETERQFQHLRERGCDLVQGFHFGAPLDVECFTAMLATRHGAKSFQPSAG